MKKLIFTACMALIFSTISAQNDYIVKTSNSNKSTQMQLVEEDDEQLESLGVEQDYIVQNFKYYSLCDWEEGMRFMVIPEKYDLVVKTFTDVATGKLVNNMPLKYHVMVYKGHHKSLDGHDRLDFYCETNRKNYYFEIPLISFDDYCYEKNGVPTLAYLGDVDIAREKLMGRTLYTKTKFYRIDVDYNSDDYRDVIVDEDMEVKVIAIGVGTRNFPVKIIVEDRHGNEFYQNVAISKTNLGMRKEDFEDNDNTKYLFAGSFEVVEDVMAINNYNYRAFIGKIIHTKYPTKILNETTRKVQSIPRLTGYQIESITPHKTDDKATIRLKNTILGSYFTADMILDVNLAENQEDYFGYIFAPGPGKRIETTEGSRAMIRAGHVGVGFSEDEVMMAAGEPDNVQNGENGIYTWIFNRSNNKLLYVEFNGSGSVSRTYTGDVPGTKKEKKKKKKVIIPITLTTVK
jgi:hypothetical protein